MRIRLSRWIRQLALIGFLTSPMTTTALAHDLPMQYMHEHYTTECFPAAKQPGVAPFGQPPAAAGKQPDSKFPQSLDSRTGVRLLTSLVRYAQPSRQLPPALLRLGQTWWRAVGESVSSNAPSSQYTLTSPAPGSPPAPSSAPLSQPVVAAQDAPVNPLRQAAAPVKSTPHAAIPAADSMIKLLRESYMPYDMSVRDWKFQHFSYRAAPVGLPATTDSPSTRDSYLALQRPVDGQPPSPRLADAASNASGANDLANAAWPAVQAPLPARRALAEGIRLVEHWQCVLQAELMDLRAVNRLSRQATTSWVNLSQALQDTTDQWLARIEVGGPKATPAGATPASLAAPVYQAPLFVVQRHGDQYIVLTESQARQWRDLQWIAPLSVDPGGSLQAWSPLRGSPPATTAPAAPSIAATHSLLNDDTFADHAPSLPPAETPAVSLHDSALHLASRQLRTWGASLLELSERLEAYGDRQLAGRTEPRNVR